MTPDTPRLSTSLREAFRLKAQSLALPLFGTGSNELDRDDLYAAILTVIGQFTALKNSHSFPVRDLRFVSDKAEYIAQLADRLAKASPV